MDVQPGWRSWPHTGFHARAAPDAPVGGRDASGGDSGCRETRCWERDGSQGDLERRGPHGGEVCVALLPF